MAILFIITGFSTLKCFLFFLLFYKLIGIKCIFLSKLIVLNKIYLIR